jgi:hypothetical protein
MEALIKGILENLPIAIPDVRSNHPINGGRSTILSSFSLGT